jgi:NAD(P)-dependent dehydrogenase (short-subunit alcohol dehydrogenase family)
VGLEPELLERLVSQLGDRAAWFEADVTDGAALQRAVDGTVDRFGGIDVAIANAGVMFVEPLSGAPAEHVERTFDVNLLGVWRTNRAVLPHVIERKGYLLNVASQGAAMHVPLTGAYGASKAGVEALTNTLRLELHPTGTSVGCAYFGIIDTDMLRAGSRHPAWGISQRLSPRFARHPVPVSRAVDAIERGIENRAARIWAPGYVGVALLARGIVQPIIDRRLTRSPLLPEALHRTESERVPDADPVLGISHPPD